MEILRTPPRSDCAALVLRETRFLLGAGGGTRTHTTLPSRDFKSLASTSSATSALLIPLAFSSQAGKCFPIEPLRFPFRLQTCSRIVQTVADPAECPDDVLLGLDVPGIVDAHAFRLVADQIGHLAGIGAVAPPPSGVGH